MSPKGVISLADRMPRYTQRLYQLVELASLDDDVAQRLREAEEAIYTDASDPLVNWSAEDLAALFVDAGLSVGFDVAEEAVEMRITQGLLERWFAAESGSKPSYAQRIGGLLSTEEVAQVQQLYRRQLLNQTVPWRSQTVYLTTRYP